MLLENRLKIPDPNPAATLREELANQLKINIAYPLRAKEPIGIPKAPLEELISAKKVKRTANINIQALFLFIPKLIIKAIKFSPC